MTYEFELPPHFGLTASLGCYSIKVMQIMFNTKIRKRDASSWLSISPLFHLLLLGMSSDSGLFWLLNLLNGRLLCHSLLSGIAALWWFTYKMSTFVCRLVFVFVIFR